MPLQITRFLGGRRLCVPAGAATAWDSERLERLQKSGLKKISRSDPDSRFLRERGGFALGYTATLAVSEEHLIVAQQIGQASTDNALLVPIVDQGRTIRRAAATSERRQRIFLSC